MSLAFGSPDRAAAARRASRSSSSSGWRNDAMSACSFRRAGAPRGPSPSRPVRFRRRVDAARLRVHGDAHVRRAAVRGSSPHRETLRQAWMVDQALAQGSSDSRSSMCQPFGAVAPLIGTTFAPRWCTVMMSQRAAGTLRRGSADGCRRARARTPRSHRRRPLSDSPVRCG